MGLSAWPGVARVRRLRLSTRVSSVPRPPPRTVPPQPPAPQLVAAGTREAAAGAERPPAAAAPDVNGHRAPAADGHALPGGRAHDGPLFPAPAHTGADARHVRGGAGGVAGGRRAAFSA